MRRPRVIITLAVAMALAVAGGGYALAAGSFTNVTFQACLSGGKLGQVQVTRTPSCASSATPVQWAGQAALPSVSPSPSPSPSPSISPSPSPSPSPTVTGAACVTSALNGTCGPYDYAGIPMSNGYDTYVTDQAVNVQAGTVNTLAANSPGDWAVTATEAPCGGCVQTYVNTTQLTNDWNGTGWGGSGTADTPLGSLSALQVNYSETTPRDAGTVAEFAPDVWNDNYGSDVMFWADTQGRCNTGSYGGMVLGTAVLGGQTWTVNRYGGPGAEIIFVLDADPNVPDSCAQQTSGTIDVLAGFQWLVSHGFMSGLGSLSQLNTGWEICEAAGATFTMSSYSITAS